MANNGTTIDCEKLDNVLRNLTTNLEGVSKKIIDDLAELALDEMQKNYSKSEYEPGEEINFYKTDSDTGKTVAMSGAQAVYSEFGTGTHGGLHPHPKKNEFNLKPYNSGETIRTATAKVHEITSKDSNNPTIPEGTLYWTYKGKDGEIHYTQGIPAQKEVYNAGKTVLKKMPSIIKKRMEEIFK